MTKTLIVIVVITLLMASVACAQGYRIDWMVFSSGGASTAGGTFTMKSTFGQPAAGYVEGPNLRHWIGFWLPGQAGTGAIPCATAAAAKGYADGTVVTVSGKIATSATSDYTMFFYVEESDRSSGIRVNLSPWSVAGLARGSVVSVSGTLSTTADGERQLSTPVVVIASTTEPLTPLGMPNRSLGGGTLGTPPWGQYGVTGGTGVNNVGLLVETWGRVTETGGGYVVIDDGSGRPVRVDTNLLSSPPGWGSYVSVIGASSLYTPSATRLPMILPRRDADIRSY